MTFDLTGMIVKALDATHTAITDVVHLVDPSATPYDIMFYMYVLTNAVLLAILFKYMFFAKTQDDIDQANSAGYSRGYREGEVRERLRSQKCSSEPMIAEGKYRKLQQVAAQVRDEQKELASRHSELTREFSIQSDHITQLEGDLKASRESADTSYRQERVIAALAKDLEGYAEVEEKAKAIVETLR